jgi:excisionase family DNA binding protein
VEQATRTAPEFMNYPTASEYTSLSRHSLWRATRRGELRVIKVGASVRFQRSDLDDFMQRHTTSSK